MRIWIIHQNAYAPSHSASSRHFELARQLTQRGHEVLIVASSFYHKGREETRLRPGQMWAKESINGVQFLWLRTPAYSGNGIARLFNMLVFAFRVWRKTGLRSEPRPDVVIGSSPHLFSPWAAMRLARSFHVPFVLEIRDIWPAVLVEMGGMSNAHPLVRLLRHLEKTYYRRAKRVISILPFADKHIQQSIGRSDHVVWIPNGSPLDSVQPPAAHGQPLTFMYAGAHSLYSGLDVVLDAAEMLERDGWGDRVRIRLVGDGPDKAKLIESAHQRGISMITFDDPVPKSRVFATLQQADAFLMVYRDAPLMRFGLCPNKLYDYLGAARPILFGMATPNNPVAEAQAGVTIKPQDAAALAQGIKDIAQTPAHERIAMGHRGRAYVEQHHNFGLLGEKLEGVLREVVNTPSVAAARSTPHKYQPVVIIGAPRSGTNMLRDVLTSIPGVCTWDCDEINPVWCSGNATTSHDELQPAQVTPRIQAYIRRMFDRLAKQHAARWVVEKTCANSLRVGFVDRVLPDAKYIFLVRDPRDAIASAMQRWTAPADLTYALKKARYVPPADLPRYAFAFVSNRVRRLLSAERRLGTWGPRFQGMQQLLAQRSLAEVCAAQWQRCVANSKRDLARIDPARVIQVKYEQFVAEPEHELAKILAHVGIEASQTERANAVRDVSRGSVGKSRSKFDDATLAAIGRIIDAQRTELGYEPAGREVLISKAA